MTTIQIVINGKVTETSFESYRRAVKFYNARVEELAPNGQRRASNYAPDRIPQNVIRLMRGRFVEEYVEF